MKILMVTNLFPPAVLGGYEILCEEVSKALTASGHKVIVQSSDYWPDDFAQKNMGNSSIEVFRNLKLYLPFSKPPSRSRTKQLLIGFYYNRHKTLKLISQIKPDIVFFWSMRRLGLGSVKAAMQSGVPYALTLNDDYLLAYQPLNVQLNIRRLLSLAIEKTIARALTVRDLSFPCITAISKSLVKNMVKSGADVGHAKIIYQGVDPELFTLKNNPGHIASPAKILYVGQVHEYKGVHTIIESFANKCLKDKNLLLDIVGTGDEAYLTRLKLLSEENGLSDKVRFLGKLNRGDLLKLYQSHDIFVFSSIWDEPFGLTHLEAMASGLPVISTTNGGPGEFLLDQQNSLTFEAGSSEDLACCIKKLLDTPALASKLALAGREIVCTKFSTKRYVFELEQFLQTCKQNWNK